MHTRGRPKDMYDEALSTGRCVAEVTLELRDRMARATAAGVPVGRILVDPGLGFAKQPEHSYGVLARLPEIAAALDRPMLVGPVAQVVPAGGRRRPRGPRPRLGDGGRCDSRPS